MPWLRAYCAASRGGSCATAHNCQPSGYVSRSRLTYGNAVSHVPHVVLKKTRRVGWPPASFGREYSLPSTPRRVKCGASAPVSSNQQLSSLHIIYIPSRPLRRSSASSVRERREQTFSVALRFSWLD